MRGEARQEETARLEAENAALRREIERLTATVESLRQHAARLQALAHEDPLTGLLNRRGFLRDLDRAIAYHARYGTPAALLFLDLDRFKPVNDSLGHAAGDAVLREVAAILRRNLRASDSVARLGGDEFGAILWQVDAATALNKGSALARLIGERPVTVADRSITVTAAVGTTSLTTTDSAETALARADAAMYADKARRAAVRR